MKRAAVVVVSCLIFHSCLSSPRTLLNLPRPLNPDETDIIVKSIHAALAGKAFRLVQERGVDDREVLMGTGGVPRMIRRTLTAVGISPNGELIGGIAGGRAIVFQMPFDATRSVITGDPAPDPAEFVPVQSLWIDTSSLLPVRWEMSQREAITSAWDFVYEPLDLQRPAGVEVPTCVSTSPRLVPP